MHAARLARFLSSSLGSTLIVATLAGCGDNTTSPDASAPVDVIVDATPDVAADKPPPQSSLIYGPCRSDNECAVGLSCSTESASGIPGGECNRVCASDEDCVLIPKDGTAAVDGYCPPAVGTAPRRCQRVCANGIDCERPGFTCRTYNSGMLTETRACIAVCTDETCVNGTVCDHESGRCRLASAMPTGRTLGQTCEPEIRAGSPTPPPDRLCRSNLCRADFNPDSRGNPYYSGWNGGYCISRCILPQGFNTSAFWGPVGMTVDLPQATCPSGGICIPGGGFAWGNLGLAVYGSYARDDLGVCMQGCQSNADCRGSDGYVCQKTIQFSQTGSRRYSNGFCFPVNCMNMATPCPTSLTCRRNTDGSGSCVPAMTMTP